MIANALGIAHSAAGPTHTALRDRPVSMGFDTGGDYARFDETYRAMQAAGVKPSSFTLTALVKRSAAGTRVFRTFSRVFRAFWVVF